jgi:hypothetical protein
VKQIMLPLAPATLDPASLVELRSTSMRGTNGETHSLYLINPSPTGPREILIGFGQSKEILEVKRDALVQFLTSILEVAR